MKKADEYRAHAAECRQLAARAADERAREQLLTMAETWDSLAIEREKQLERVERVKKLDQRGDPE